MARPMLDVTVTSRGDATVVRPAGLLDIATAPQLRDALLKAIADQPGAVIVDLDRLELRKAYTLSVLTAVARRTAEWSGVPLVLAAGNATDARLQLHTRAIARFLPVYPTVDKALASAHLPPVRRITRLRLAPQAHAPATARRLVQATCEIWNCPDLADDAALVASELVANAVAHAGTDFELRLELRRDLLTVALTDGNPEPPALQPDGADLLAVGGFGLVIIEALTRCWGWAPTTRGGKIVWAVLRNPGRGSPGE